MANSPRERLCQAIVSQLESISLANGYRGDVDKVYRVDVLPDQFTPTEKRVVEFLESLSPETLEYLASGVSGGYISRVQFVVSGILKQGTVNIKSPDRHTAVNDFGADVIKALMEDPRFGGSACKESEISSPVYFVDSERPEALFNLTLTCWYAYGRADL